MGKITKTQLENINNRCRNDWRFDVQYFMYHSEKTLIKQIKLDNENYLEFALRYNYKNQISLHISKFYHEQGAYFATSHGLGKSKILNEEQATRKNFNKLIEYTNILTNDELMRINKETQVIKNGIFIESEEF